MATGLRGRRSKSRCRPPIRQRQPSWACQAEPGRAWAAQVCGAAAGLKPSSRKERVAMRGKARPPRRGRRCSPHPRWPAGWTGRPRAPARHHCAGARARDGPNGCWCRHRRFGFGAGFRAGLHVGNRRPLQPRRIESATGPAKGGEANGACGADCRECRVASGRSLPPRMGMAASAPAECPAGKEMEALSAAGFAPGPHQSAHCAALTISRNAASVAVGSLRLG